MQAPVFTEIPPYGVDEETDLCWKWLQTVGQLVAAELAAMPRGTLALADDGDCVYWAALIEDHIHLATAPVSDGVIHFEHSALLRQLIGYSVEELHYLRGTLENWLQAQTTMRISDQRELQRWPTLPANLTD
ncbi:hypothetical protein IGB42_00494 [Andreprevotia sp. IGB-42]|uniref:hypothetical protein n=1 Tax=Andreprevotia sp. IGB-42 TaxID=2497473 RepID=UPI00135946A2|nr:hypothetical protein [Andreprevotia sp. IGB-42]KAF0815413.1 hypothetical protein IGB42_00494 [Andreprevotia sp. IGB-42]